MNIEFARRLKLLRRERGISQETLANQIGVKRSTVAGWENASRMPSLPTLRVLALYFNVSSDYLSGRRRERTNIIDAPMASMDLSKLNHDGLQMLFEYYRFLANDKKYRSHH